MAANRSAQERFWGKVDRAGPGGCWLWTAALQTSGYGHVWIEGRSRTAHKVSYEWAKGGVPDGLQLDHTCRVRHCVNPAHLEPVTSRENSLRSPFTVNSINAQKVMCPQGHPYDKLSPSGYRYCSVCWLKRKTPTDPKVDACPQGHPYRYSGGRRWCPQCRAELARRRYESKRSGAGSSSA